MSCDDNNIRLQNWVKWLHKWNKIQGRIGEKLNVEPGDLVENLSEDFRNINEERQVIDYAKIPTYFDKYRGKPDFYKLPTVLTTKQKCCCYCYPNPEPVYFAVRSLKERYVVPSLELVGIPEVIRREKNILNGARNIYKKWQNGKYRQEQMSLLSEKIKNIVPHWPDFDHLAVVGSKIIPELEAEESKKSQENIITEEVEKNLNEPDKELDLSPHSQRRSVDIQINGISFTEKTCKKIRVFFEYDIQSDDIVADSIHLVNTGPCTMRISWKKIEKFLLFRDITEEHRQKFGFYFDKRELIILPRREVDLPIWFKTETPGAYSESWELITRPKIDGGSVILSLESYSYFKNMKEKINKTVERIDARAKIILIQDILGDIAEKVTYEEHEAEGCVFEEAQLFEIANLTSGRPRFLYDETLVGQLRELYMTLTRNERQWDFSVKDLTKLAHHRDIMTYLEVKRTRLASEMERIENQNGEHPELISEEKTSAKGDKYKKKSAKGKAKKLSEKQENVEEKKETIEEEPYVYSNQLEVWNVVQKLDTPVIINSKREKYFACVEIVTSYFSKMCISLESLEDEKGVKVQSIYPPIKNRLIPVNDLPERLIYERFEDHYLPLRSDEKTWTSEAKRRPKNVRNISSDDIEVLYTTYFNKGLVTKETKSKSKLENDKSSKKPEKLKSSKKKDNSKEQKTVPEEISIDSFKPYAEDFMYIPEIEDAEVPAVAKPIPLTGKEAENYYYNEYLIVYSCLSNAVDALVDTIHSFECVVPHTTLKEVKEQIRHFK